MWIDGEYKPGAASTEWIPCAYNLDSALLAISGTLDVGGVTKYVMSFPHLNSTFVFRVNSILFDTKEEAEQAARRLIQSVDPATLID